MNIPFLKNKGLIQAEVYTDMGKSVVISKDYAELTDAGYHLKKHDAILPYNEFNVNFMNVKGNPILKVKLEVIQKKVKDKETKKEKIVTEDKYSLVTLGKIDKSLVEDKTVRFWYIQQCKDTVIMYKEKKSPLMEAMPLILVGLLSTIIILNIILAPKMLNPMMAAMTSAADKYLQAAKVLAKMGGAPFG